MLVCDLTYVWRPFELTARYLRDSISLEYFIYRRQLSVGEGVVDRVDRSAERNFELCLSKVEAAQAGHQVSGPSEAVVRREFGSGVSHEGCRDY